MKETVKTLWAEYTRNDQLIKDLEKIGKYDETEALYKRQDEILNKLEKLSIAKMENETKRMQIKAEDKREKKKLIFQIVSWATGLGVSIWAFVTTLKFDREHTLTSTNGRSVVGRIIDKITRF